MTVAVAHSEREIVSIRNRWWMIAPGVYAVGAVLTAFFDQTRATSAIFDSYTAILSWDAWGVVWFMVGVAAVFCAATGSWVGYFMANLGAFIGAFTFFVSAGWARFVSHTAQSPGIVLAVTGVAAFAFLFALSIPTSVVKVSRIELVEILNETR